MNNILTAYSGLAFAFIIITSILGYLLISTRLKLILKLILIPIVIWYSLVLFYAPGKMMGWPTYTQLPKESRIIYYIIKEPHGVENGAIYLWIIEYNPMKKSLLEQLNPKNIFSYNETSAPRAYKIPYNRKNHAGLIEVVEEMKISGGVLTLQFQPPRPGSDIWDSDSLKFKLINPEIILKKDGSEISDDN